MRKLRPRGMKWQPGVHSACMSDSQDLNPGLSLDKSFSCQMKILMKPVSFKLTGLKEFVTENPLRQNLAQEKAPPFVVGPLTLQTDPVFSFSPGSRCGRVTAHSRRPERGGGQLDAVWMRGTDRSSFSSLWLFVKFSSFALVFYNFVTVCQDKDSVLFTLLKTH